MVQGRRKKEIISYPGRLKREADVVVTKNPATPNNFTGMNNTVFTTNVDLAKMIQQADLPEFTRILWDCTCHRHTYVFVVMPNGVGYCGIAFKHPDPKQAEDDLVEVLKIALGRALASYKYMNHKMSRFNHKKLIKRLKAETARTECKKCV